MVDKLKEFQDKLLAEENAEADKTETENQVEPIIVLEPMKSEDLDVSEDIKAIFEGQDLDADFKTRAKLIFKTAVITKINEHVDEVNENATIILQEKVDELDEQLIKTMDEYLKFVVTEWSEENKLAIESSVKVDVAEKLLDGIKTIFSENFIDVPEEKLDVVESLTAELDKTKSQLNDQINMGLELSESVVSSAKAKCINDMCSDLTDTQMEKICSLAENVEFECEESFKESINDIKESYFPLGEKPDEGVLDENLSDADVVLMEQNKPDSKPIIAPNMQKYITAGMKLGRK